MQYRVGMQVCQGNYLSLVKAQRLGGIDVGEMMCDMQGVLRSVLNYG